MGKKPAVIIIIRHGTRLDAVDQDWHRSSTAPHDPPLTYGGWNQSRSLGMRIGALLRDKEHELAEKLPIDLCGHDDSRSHVCSDGIDGGAATRPTLSRSKRPIRPLKVFIHTSPYQRCVQTSVAITAGLVQDRCLAANPHHGRISSTHSSLKPVPYSASTGPKFKNRGSPSSASLSSSPHTIDPARDSRSASGTTLPSDSSASEPLRLNAILRIDACLGEWLSPEYSVLPKRPPDSKSLVAAAKAELSRPCDAIETFSPVVSASQGDLWGSNLNGSFTNTPDIRAVKSPDASAITKRSLSSALPGMAPAPYSSEHDHSHSLRHVSNPTPSLVTDFSTGYQAPVPAYAILPTEPIPKGHVAHARDACTDVDFEWDSLVPPLCWGEGGEYGEEWTALHKRFRSSLSHLIKFYSRDHLKGEGPPSHHRLYRHDEDDETALIIVTHSAGCNALIGALTDQPVLLDVGVASLTMAVRKDQPLLAEHELSEHTPWSTLYDTNIVASIDHLRAATNSAPSALMSGPISISGSARRNTVLAPNISSSVPDAHGFGRPMSRRRSINASMGSVRRPCVSPVFSYRSDSLTSISSANGLWSPGGPMATSEFPDRANTSPPFSSPLSGSPMRDDVIVPPKASSPINIRSDMLGSSMASDATIRAPNGTRTAEVNTAGSSKTDVSADQTFGTTPRPPITTSHLANALAMAHRQEAPEVNTAPPLDTTRPTDDDGERHAQARGSGISSDGTIDSPGRPLAKSRPEPIPHRGLQRAVSQMGLWGSFPADVLDHRYYGLGKHQ